MDARLSLVNFLGQDKYNPITIPKYNALPIILRFIQEIDNYGLINIFKVGIIEIRRRIINSSRSMTMVSDFQCQAVKYIFILYKNKDILKGITKEQYSKYLDPNYKVYMLFVYLYFISINSDSNHSLCRQQVLDMMLAYSINKRYLPMLDFIFMVIVSERQIYDGTTNLKCSQYSDLDNIIKSFSHSKDELLSKHEQSSIDKPYLDSYTDAYSEALEWQTELENAYERTILDFEE